MGRRRDKKKKVRTGTKMDPAWAWTRMHEVDQRAHPRYIPESPDLAFARRAIGTALTNAKTKRAVDIGAGSGEITSELHRTGGNVTLVDFAKVQTLPHKMPVESFRASAEKLPGEWTGKFGVALTAYSFDYTNKEKAVAEVKRVLERNGRLVAMLHHPNSAYLESLKLTREGTKKIIQILTDVKNSRIKNYEQFLEAVQKEIPPMTARMLKMEDTFRIMQKYFKFRREFKTGIPQERNWLRERLEKNIQLQKTVYGAFKPLFEKSGAIFPNEAAVRQFFESHGFRVRYLKTLKFKEGPHKGETLCYALYAQKI